MDTLIKHQYGQTSMTLTAHSLLAKYASSLVDSHASHFHQLENNLEVMMKGTNGPKQGELLGKSNQNGFALKMFQLSFMDSVKESQHMEQQSLMTLPAWGMTANGELFQLVTQGPNISAKGSGYWPTRRAIYGEHPGMTDPNHLTGAVKMWATPRASDYKGSGPYGSKSFHHMLDRSYLCAQVIEPDIKGNLSPDWTEWLMGVPAGWTKLEPMAEGAFENWKRRMMDGTWWNDEHDLPRITPNDDKLKKKDRAKRVKALGNGIVPRVIPVFLHHLKGTKNGHI